MSTIKVLTTIICGLQSVPGTTKLSQVRVSIKPPPLLAFLRAGCSSHATFTVLSIFPSHYTPVTLSGTYVYRLRQHIPSSTFPLSKYLAYTLVI